MCSVQGSTEFGCLAARSPMATATLTRASGSSALASVVTKSAKCSSQNLRETQASFAKQRTAAQCNSRGTWSVVSFSRRGRASETTFATMAPYVPMTPFSLTTSHSTKRWMRMSWSASLCSAPAPSSLSRSSSSAEDTVAAAAAEAYFAVALFSAAPSSSADATSCKATWPTTWKSFAASDGSVASVKFTPKAHFFARRPTTSAAKASGCESRPNVASSVLSAAVYHAPDSFLDVAAFDVSCLRSLASKCLHAAATSGARTVARLDAAPPRAALAPKTSQTSDAKAAPSSQSASSCSMNRAISISAAASTAADPRAAHATPSAEMAATLLEESRPVASAHSARTTFGLASRGSFALTASAAAASSCRQDTSAGPHSETSSAKRAAAVWASVLASSSSMDSAWATTLAASAFTASVSEHASGSTARIPATAQGSSNCRATAKNRAASTASIADVERRSLVTSGAACSTCLMSKAALLL
mmetsp:Transcript_8478/g.27902  ORF Transcript_8478/g.27902 Transcript_8478/m.27902 type:complete len:477 (+) Transcript_8478:988-2418(+)